MATLLSPGQASIRVKIGHQFLIEVTVEYRVTFYQTEAGAKPVTELLSALNDENPVLHKFLTAGIRKCKQRANHGEPLTGSLGMLELRVDRTDIVRGFFFFRPNQEIVCTNGYVKKSRTLDPVELARAERYKADWERRNP